jgi:hypothetical protein
MQSNKKKLIARIAGAAALALALSLVGLAVSEAVLEGRREQRLRDAAREREELVERSRQYLAEAAGRVRQVPVDPALLAEIESRYFEEHSVSPMHVWAMDTQGGFLFGVPREVFEKLNAVYNADVAPNLREGLFVDRQTFLRRFADASEEIGPGSFKPAPEEDDTDAWQRLRRYLYDSDETFVVSTPLKDADGRALGSLYLKRSLPQARRAGGGGTAASVNEVSALAAGGAAFLLWLLLPTWVYVDARGRSVRRAWLFAFLTALSGPIGLLVYLIARPETPAALTCPGCSREVDGGAFCPHCGQDLSVAFCATCRYPLKPDWAFCPACRTEIRPRPAAAASPASEPAA